MVCKRQYASQFGTEIASSIRKNAPGPHRGTSVYMCPPILNRAPHLINPGVAPAAAPQDAGTHAGTVLRCRDRHQ